VPGTIPIAPPVPIDPEEARAALGGRAIGPHLALAAGLPRALERVRAIGAGAIQVFADDPTAWRRKPEPPPGIDAFRQALLDLGVGPVAIHASYLVNLATPDAEVQARSIEVMIAELRMGEQYGARFVNVHIGSHRGTGLEAGLDRAGETIARILDAVPPGADVPLLVLEDSAGQGDSVGVTMAEIGAILAAAARSGADPGRVAVCLDTAHLWSAGYALDDPAGVDALVAEVSGQVGLDRLAMLHLNDSRVKRGSRVDRHEHLGAGGVGSVGLRALLTHPGLSHVPAYLETPGMDTGWDAVNMDRVRRLLGGEALPALPPAAFQARGERR
jgi:deoxyribonuclease IV